MSTVAVECEHGYDDCPECDGDLVQREGRDGEPVTRWQMRPDRLCNGGLDTTSWCGEPAMFVARRGTGRHPLECFVCEKHGGDDVLIPIDEWFEQAGLVPSRATLEEGERLARETLEEMG